MLRFLVAIKLLILHPLIVFGLKKSADLTVLERELLEVVKEGLSDADREVLYSQLKDVNLIERVHIKNTVVSFNVIDGFRYSLERISFFQGKGGERKLAKVDFFIEGKKVRVIFYIVNGIFYSMEFTGLLSKNQLDQSPVIEQVSFY